MVVCKFFLAGNCRFGSNCRFEHTYSSKYSYHAPQTQNQPPPQQASGVTNEQLINQVKADVQAALTGGQWILSSYSPFKEKPVLPGIPDISPEEARLLIYEAKANNNLDQVVAYLNKVTQESRRKYEALLQPSAAITNTLRSLYNGEPVTSPFTIGQASSASSNTGASIFRSAVQNSNFSQSTNVFGPANTNTASSVFAQANQNANTAASIFGQANSAFGTSDPKSVFAQASQNVFATPTSPFAQSPDPAKSLFAQANQGQPSGNVFQSPPQAVNPASVFASANAGQQPQQSFFTQPTQQPSNPFLQTQAPATNIFQTANQDQQISESDLYSELAKLTNDDIEAFKSPSFKLGFIPEVPPPLELVQI